MILKCYNLWHIFLNHFLLCFIQPQYLALEQVCQDFAVELLGMCRNQSEVTTILNSLGDQDEDSEDELDQQAFEEGIPNLARLRLAVNCNQKQVRPQALTPQNKGKMHCYLLI